MNDIRWVVPVPQGAPDELITYELAHEFYQEVGHREALERHCQWYHATAEANRQELQRMRGDFNLLGWFYGKRRS